MKSIGVLLALLSAGAFAPVLDAQSSVTVSFRRELRHTSDADRPRHVRKQSRVTTPDCAPRHDHADRHRHEAVLEYVPGHYAHIQKEVWIECRDEVICEQVLVPGHYEDSERIEYRSGRRVTVRMRVWVDACMKTVERVVHHPGYFKTVCEQVWVPGRFVTNGCR